MISEASRKRIFTPNGLIPGTVLVDGFVRGTWKLETAGRRREQAATLRIQPFEPLPPADHDALTEEGHRLLDSPPRTPPPTASASPPRRNQAATGLTHSWSCRVVGRGRHRPRWRGR